MRRPLALLPLGLAVLVVAEIATFVAVAHAVGGLAAVLIVVASGLAGVLLLRREGVKGWRAFRAAAESGRPPGPQVSNSLVGLLGALLLAVPGFLTSAVGLVMLLPGVRGLTRLGVQRATARLVSPAVAGDLFGPRRVRVRRGDPLVDVAADEAAAPARPEAVVEGEIVR